MRFAANETIVVSTACAEYYIVVALRLFQDVVAVLSRACLVLFFVVDHELLLELAKEVFEFGLLENAQQVVETDGLLTLDASDLVASFLSLDVALDAFSAEDVFAVQ